MILMVFTETLLYKITGVVIMVSILGGVGLGVVVALYMIMMLEMRERVIR